MIHPFRGTLFRFPLRTIAQAATSRLSKQSFTPEDLSRFLESLSLELVEIMIFLKNVESVEVYEWNPGVPGPDMMYSCCLKSGSEARRQRQSFLRLAKGMSFGDEAPTPEIFKLELVRKGGGDEESVSSFLVAQMMAPSSSRISSLARNAYRDYGMRLLPLVAIAASLSEVEWRHFGHPTREWMKEFWGYLCSERRSLAKLKSWPLLPTTRGSLRRPWRHGNV